MSVTCKQARSDWAELDHETLDEIRQFADSFCFEDTPYADLLAAGFALLMPVCQRWRDFARSNLRGHVVRYLSLQIDAGADYVECVPHLVVDYTYHHDAVARLRYFPNIQDVTVSLLHYKARPAFEYLDYTDSYQGPCRGEPIECHGLMQIESRLLATFTLRHLTSLTLKIASGDCMCALTWETLPDLSELRVEIRKRVSQGTFAFLPRIPSLRLLSADVDFFSVRCLQFLSNLQRLDLSVAKPDDGYLTDSQACERNDHALACIAKLPRLEHLDMFQPISLQAVAQLTSLCTLTSLQLPVSRCGEARSFRLWDIQKLFQENSFYLRRLHFVFKLDTDLAVASMSNMAADSVPCHNHVQIPVAWSPEPILVKQAESGCLLSTRKGHQDLSSSDDDFQDEYS